MLDNPFSAEIFTAIQCKPPVAQIEAISPFLIAFVTWENKPTLTWLQPLSGVCRDWWGPPWASWFYLEYCFVFGIRVTLYSIAYYIFPNDHWFLSVRVLWEGSELLAVFLKESKYSFWRVWKLDFRLMSTLFAVYPQYIWIESTCMLKSSDTGAVSALQIPWYLVVCRILSHRYT